MRYLSNIYILFAFLFVGCEYQIPEGYWVYSSEEASVITFSPDSTINGHGYIDLDLPSGTLWAVCNVGANVYSESGDYYAWGETETKSEYSKDNYSWPASFKPGDPEHDVARAKWGGNWRMPTDEDFQELIDNCKFEPSYNGCVVMNLKTGKSVFFPITGYYYGSKLYSEGELGSYWSSTLYSSGIAYSLFVRKNSYSLSKLSDPYDGRSVRPVCNKGDIYNVNISCVGRGSFDIKDYAETVTGFSAGSVITVTAIPDEGYGFIGWFVGNSETPVSTEATYEFTVKEDITLVAKFEEEIITETEKINGYEAVDLGLPSGLKWATCNVGASKPEEYGDYYAWGEIETNSDYSWSTYKWCNGSYDTLTKYCTNSSYGTVDNKTVLDPEDDVAHVKWGGDWRMPTKAEIQELGDECTWIWTTQNGVYGNKVTGPNGNSIFLPAAGYRNGTDLGYRGGDAYYWSSSLYDRTNYYACCLGFNEDNFDWYLIGRCNGLSVRPVSE